MAQNLKCKVIEMHINAKGKKLAVTKGAELGFKILQVLIISPRATVNHPKDRFHYNLSKLS